MVIQLHIEKILSYREKFRAFIELEYFFFFDKVLIENKKGGDVDKY